MTDTVRRYALTPRAQLIHHVMQVHRRIGAHTCSCGFEYPLGQDVTLHTADCIDAALALHEQQHDTAAADHHDDRPPPHDQQQHPDTPRLNPWHL